MGRGHLPAGVKVESAQSPYFSEVKRENVFDIKLENTANTKRWYLIENKKDYRTSNNMKDAVKTICQICFGKFTLGAFTVHVRLVHNLSLEENRQRFGHERSHLSETVRHRCGICSLLILLSTASLRDHAKYHKISSREYNRKFITLIKPTKKDMRQKYVDEEMEEGEVVKEK